MVLTVYRLFLCLYPASYRHEFGEEMTSVFLEARGDVARDANFAFTDTNSADYFRALCVLIWSAWRALPFHFGGSICNRSFVFLAPPCF